MNTSYVYKILKKIQSCTSVLPLRKIGIFKRLSIFFLIPLLLIVAITYFSYSQYAKENNRNLDRFSSLLVQNLELKISDIMQDYEDIAKSIYNDNQLITALIQNTQFFSSASSVDRAQYVSNCDFIENKLYQAGYNKKYISNIQLVTPFRQYRMTSSQGIQKGYTIQNLNHFYQSDFYLLPQQNYGYPTWIDNRLQAKTFFTADPPIAGTIASTSGITNTVTLGVAVYVPVIREFLGVLLMNIDLEAFSTAADNYQNDNTGNILLVGREGTLLFFDPSLSAPSIRDGQNLFENLLLGEQGVVRPRLNNQDVLLAYKKIPSTEIFVVYLDHLSSLLADTYQVQRFYVLVVVCILVICFLLSYSVTSSIVDPLHQLIHVMKTMGDGKWSARYPSSGHDEITILGEQFNDMAEKLNQLVNQVYLAEIRRQKALLRQKNAQLDALLMQINPHFLYNTLDIIRWEAMFEAHGETNATRMIEKFSSLCRMGMRIGNNTIRLREGLDHANAYLEVINFRHQDKIQLLQKNELNPDTYYIPPFLLQPLIENSVVHGFRDGSKGFYISIHCFLKDGSLYILVKDNGKGIPPQELKRLQDTLRSEKMSEESIGLVNVNQRIRLFYGEPYGLHVDDTPAEGTSITICLPVRTYSEKIEGRTEL